jgi:hypothetical protein
MPDDFIGELSKTRLFDLLAPLAAGKKSGMVGIRGGNEGEIHLEGGNIIHARCALANGAEAVLAMAEWRRGRVPWDWRAAGVGRTVAVATDEILKPWAAREEEWDRIGRAFSSPGAVLRISLHVGPEDKKVSATQWRVLALCDGKKSIGEIGALLGWPLFDTEKTACEMLEEGLLEKVSDGQRQEEPSGRAVNGDFFHRLEDELKKVVGPIATLILDEVMDDFGESAEAFPESRVQPFIEAVGETIDDESKRARFMRLMMVHLARLVEP